MDTFRSRDYEFYPFTDVPHHKVYYWDYILKNDISNHDYWKHGYRSFHHSIEHPDGSGEEFRDHLSHETRHRRWRQLSRLQDATIGSGQSEKPNTIEILSRTSFLRVNWVRSAAREATMDETRRHNDHDYHEYRIRPYQQEKSNTIPTSQWSAIISWRTYNQWRDLTPESAIPRTERQLQVSTVATTFFQFERSASTSIVVYTYNSSNLEEARRTVKTTKAIGRVSEWRR